MCGEVGGVSLRGLLTMGMALPSARRMVGIGDMMGRGRMCVVF